MDLPMESVNCKLEITKTKLQTNQNKIRSI